MARQVGRPRVGDGRWLGERGATAIEWLGAGVAVAVLAVAVAAGIDPSAKRVGASLSGTVCELAAAGGVGGGGCDERPDRAAEARRVAPPRTLSRPTTLTARLDTRRGETGVREVAFADGLFVSTQWCAQTALVPGRGGTQIEVLACELAQGTRTCTRQSTPPGATPDRLTCEGETIDPRALNCTAPHELDRLCTIADARGPGEAGALRWLDCHEQTETQENATLGHFACTSTEPPGAPAYLGGCNEDWTSSPGSVYHHQVLCVGPDGFVRACRGAADNPLGCSRWLQSGSGPCGTPAADGRAICVLQRGREPYACPTATEPARRCQDVRVAECTMAGSSPHDCLERDPGPLASPQVCPAPTRGRRLTEVDLTRVEIQFCATQADPRPGETLARSFGFASRRTDHKGEITHSYTARDPDPVVPKGVKTPTGLMFAVDTTQDVLEGARCATGITGIDGKGRAVKVWSGGRVEGSKWVDATKEDGGLVVKSSSTLYPNPSPEKGAPAMFQEDDYPPVQELATGVGRVAFGPGGLGLFSRQGEADSEDARLLHAGFAEIYGQLGQGGLQTPLPGLAVGRGALGQALTRAAAAQPWSSPADGVQRAVAIYRRLAALASGLVPSAPLTGCAGARDPAATWWADSIHELKRVSSPTFADWCIASKGTGAVRGISQKAIESAFELSGVPCDQPSDDEVDVSPPASPPATCRVVRPAPTSASLAVAIGPGGGCGL